MALVPPRFHLHHHPIPSHPTANNSPKISLFLELGPKLCLCPQINSETHLMMRDSAASSLPASSERSSFSALDVKVKEGIESDGESRRVPEIGGEAGVSSTFGREAIGGVIPHAASSEGGQKRRGRSQADKENKRLKRLLRNRVSAQQARERKKAYLSDMEMKVKDLEAKNSELEERLSTLQNENQMLRQILKNTTASRRGGSDSNEGSV